MDHGQIIQAIENRNRLEIDYGAGQRTVEPHTYGNNKNGNDLLRVYQLEGASASGHPEGWKLLVVNDIRSGYSTSQIFADPRPGYTRGDSAMNAGIYAEL